jgi:hypothetical protein
MKTNQDNNDGNDGVRYSQAVREFKIHYFQRTDCSGRGNPARILSASSRTACSIYPNWGKIIGSGMLFFINGFNDSDR